MGFTIAIRALAAFLAIAELGLILYVARATDTWDNSRVVFMIFNGAWSLAVLIYVGLCGSRSFFSRKLALLFVFCTMVFWLAGSIALTIQVAPEPNHKATARSTTATTTTTTTATIMATSYQHRSLMSRGYWCPDDPEPSEPWYCAPWNGYPDDPKNNPDPGSNDPSSGDGDDDDNNPGDDAGASTSHKSDLGLSGSSPVQKATMAVIALGFILWLLFTILLMIDTMEALFGMHD